MSNRNDVYNKISEELDQRISKRTDVIEWIKWQLFDVFTLWNDNLTQESCKQILEDMNNKLEKAKKENPPRENYIKSLEFIIRDVENRKDNNKKAEVVDNNTPHLDLDVW